MKKGGWRNWFFVFGIAAIAVMLFTFEDGLGHAASVLKNAGFLLPAILLVWLVIYLMNACAWQLIIRDGSAPKVPFLMVFKLTVTGYTLNYLTPVIGLGGEPYRILELSRFVGKTKATSAVALNAMMHVLSHFCFWTASLLLYLLLHFVVGGRYVLDGWTCVIFCVASAFFAIVFWAFMRAYRHGLVVGLLGLLARLPWIGHKAAAFLDANREKLLKTDAQIAALHSCRKGAFWCSLSLEFWARVVGCIENWLIFSTMLPGFSFLDSVLIVAFSSLFSNLLFFFPMQLGTREGGIALAAGGLSIPADAGLFTSLVTRVRELIWIIIGIGLMKIGNGKDSSV